jgi:hypothetical protein
MSNHDKLAAPELAAIDVKGMSRQAFMVRSAIAAGSVYGLASVAPFVSEALAQEGGGDVDILNFALTLEYLESAFYEQALKNVNGLDGEVKKLATTLQENEAEHVDALTEAIKGLGGTPTKAPGVDFGNAFSSQKAFLKTAQTFEDLGVSAYNGAAPGIKSKEVLGSAGSIVQVEARHAAAIRSLNNQPITPAAFDKAMKMDEVLQAVKPYVKS